jgi:hypothetical protein
MHGYNSGLQLLERPPRRRGSARAASGGRGGGCVWAAKPRAKNAEHYRQTARPFKDKGYEELTDYDGVEPLG